MKHQLLMADFYTQFVREISSAVRARGRKAHHHLNGEFDAPPSVRGLLSMSWDWRRWVRC